MPIESTVFDRSTVFDSMSRRELIEEILRLRDEKIELLKQPENKYKVCRNSCQCHPETCCCDPWAVYSLDGEKHSTHWEKEVAVLVAKALNAT